MRRLVVALVLLVATSTVVAAASACGPGTSGSAAKRPGLRGLVTISPTRPVCIEGRPCSKPAAGVFLVFRRDERVAARVKTLADGTYRVALRPGRYAVSTPGLSRISRLEPRMVRVPRSGSAVVHFTIDSGLQ